MTAKDIVAELKKLGSAQTKKTWMNHGAQEPCFGVKVADMKKIQKRVKKDYLRSSYLRHDGTVGYRCPGEPEAHYQTKGGKYEDVAGRKCLCNALLANIGMGQLRPDGSVEPALVTAGLDAASLKSFLVEGSLNYTAGDVIHYLLGPAGLIGPRTEHHRMKG